MRQSIALAIASLLFVSSAAAAGKVRVLLDTDAYNEIDDQFFLDYSLSQTVFDIVGVNGTQYQREQGSADESYYEIRQIMRLMGYTPHFPVVRGSDDAMADERTPRQSEASDLIVRLAKNPDPRPLYILATGALTNVGSALVLHPEIKPRLRVIWLGGFPPDGRMDEFNCKNDRAAVKAVFESGVNLTVVPTETSARFLTLSYNEAASRLSHTGLIGDYLLSLLREYGMRQDKIIWDLSTTAYLKQIVVTGARFFVTKEEKAPRIDLAAKRYVHDVGPHTITVCGRPDRNAIFADFFRAIPVRKTDDPPYVISALTWGDGRHVDVTFSEPMDARSASNPACYSAGVPVEKSEPAGIAGVRLTLSSPMQSDRIDVTCVRDIHETQIAASRASASVRHEFSIEPGLRLDAFVAAKSLKALPTAHGPRVYDGIVTTLDWPSPAFPAVLEGEAQPLLLIASGSLYVPLDHRYEFTLKSLGLSRVYLNGRLLLDQSEEGDLRNSRILFLKAGTYNLRIEDYSEPKHQGFTLEWNLPFHRTSLIPDTVLFHAPKSASAAH